MTIDTAFISVQIFERFEKYLHGVTVQMLIDRSHANTNKGSKRWVNKSISMSPEHAVENIENLLMQINSLKNTSIRLYSSLNPRKMHNAIKSFKHAQLDIGPSAESDFYRNIQAKFVSKLMSPENKVSKYFLLDIDTLDYDNIFPIDVAICEKNIIIRDKYRSPNGWHYIAEPFDVRFLEKHAYCDIKKDGLIILYSPSIYK